VIGGREGFVPNPVLAGLVGVCPLVAAATNLASGFSYGLGAALCAIALGVIVPPARIILPDRLQAPATLALSAALALLFGFCLRIYSPVIASSLWIYLPLIAVSGLSLKSLRLSSLSSRFGPDGRSRLATISIEAFMFLLTSTFIGGARELFGLGILTLPSSGLSLSSVTVVNIEPLRMLVSPAGGFMLLGFLVAAYRAVYRASRGLARSGGRKGQ
jgi:Na+-translocating ferredoxin:NAD+ oxidoreductase subunit E